MCEHHTASPAENVDAVHQQPCSAWVGVDFFVAAFLFILHTNLKLLMYINEMFRYISRGRQIHSDISEHVFFFSVQPSTPSQFYALKYELINQ